MYLIKLNFQARIQKRRRAKLHYTEDDNLLSGDSYKMLLIVRMDLKMGKGAISVN